MPYKYFNDLSSTGKTTQSTISQDGNTNQLQGQESPFESQETFDSVPHIRKAADSGDFSQLASYGNDPDAGGLDLLSKYQKTRTGVETGVEYAQTGINYVFITKPNLNLKVPTADGGRSANAENDSALYNVFQNSFIEYVARNYPDIIQSLVCESSSSNKQAYIPLLFNYYKGTSLEDHSFSEGTYSETFRGFSQHLPTTAAGSFAGGSITVNYDEISPPLVTYLHKVWFEYIESVKFNLMYPSVNSINRREIDYMSSLYYFLMAPDAETILFWAKYTGIFPQNVPYSSFSSGDLATANLIQTSISYVYNYKEFLNPEILIDFNDTFCNSSDIMAAQAKYKGDILDVYDTSAFQDKIANATGSNKNDMDSGGASTYKSPTLEPRGFDKVGVFKDGKNYKLRFFN